MILSLSKQLKPVRLAICFLTVSRWCDSSKAGVCLYLGRFSIFCSISAHGGALFSIYCFVDCLSSPGLCCSLTHSHSLLLSPPLSYTVTSSSSSFPLFFFFLNCTVGEADKQVTHVALTAPLWPPHPPRKKTTSILWCSLLFSPFLIPPHSSPFLSVPLLPLFFTP